MSDDLARMLADRGLSLPEAHNKAALFTRAEQQLIGGPPSEIVRWFVPGRIEVLGKHTDYAGGCSLLCTAERGFCISARPRTDSQLRIHDAGRKISFATYITSDMPIPASGWTVYPSVVARRLARNFPGPFRGADIALASDLPAAAGMSSSSALVTAIFAVLSHVNRLHERDEYRANIRSVEDLASYLGCLENGQSYGLLTGDGGVGTFGGSEDHTAILASEPGHLKQYSFCPARHERTVKLPADCVFVIFVSGVVADKTGSAKQAYNNASLRARQVLECWRSATGDNAPTLAAALASSPDALPQLRSAIEHHIADPAQRQSLLNRLDQFWDESERIIPAASNALARADLTAFGNLVDESQHAAETLLGNQVPETVRLARHARALGAHAASAFGAGFGGSVWALVPANDADRFASQWRRDYQLHFPAHAFTCTCFTTSAAPPLLHL